MNGRHFEDWELLAFLDENEEAIDRSSVQAHVKGCRDCRMNLDSLRSVHEILADHSVHEFASRPATRPEPARLKEARTLTRQMEEEDRAAETTFRQMAALPIDRWLPHLETRSASRTEGLIRRVVREARAEFDRDPGRALEMLSVAAGIANALQDAFGIANERATISKERANALRMLGRYREALDELEWAEQFLNYLPTRIFDLALVYWARATVLFSMTRYAEALPVVRRATAILRQFGDLPRARQAGVLEASILLEMGEIDDAESLFGALAEAFKATNDRETFARLQNNLADCALRSGDLKMARTHAETALQLYDQMGMRTERTRVEWILARLQLRERRYDVAATTLRDVSDKFERLGLAAEAGGALLDLVEIHVTRKEWEAARKLAERLAGLFTTSAVPIHAARACAYLREAVQAQRANTQLVAYVRDYVTQRDVEMPFAPPA